MTSPCSVLTDGLPIDRQLAGQRRHRFPRCQLHLDLVHCSPTIQCDVLPFGRTSYAPLSGWGILLAEKWGILLASHKGSRRGQLLAAVWRPRVLRYRARCALLLQAQEPPLCSSRVRVFRPAFHSSGLAGLGCLPGGERGTRLSYQAATYRPLPAFHRRHP
jgi:hypothetical protein